MRRKLTIAMLYATASLSPAAQALGVGEVEVRSTLQMPLHAVIPLTDTVGLEPGLLRVSMASARDFEAAGLVRTPLVTGIRTAVNQAQGQWRVELASEGAITEPWLDLLLRFDWPGGQQLREVTLLLDPPGYDQLPVLVQAPVSVSVPPRPTTVASSPPSRPVGAAARTPTGTAWVASGDTLWNVATRLRPDSGISMDQMMIALVEANPEVFPSGNINAMRAGFALNVPSREAIAARTAQESREIVLAMNQAWAQRGRGAPVSVPLGGATSAVAMASAAPGTVEAVPPAPDTGTAASQAAPGDAPQLVQPEPEPRLTLLSDAELAAEGEAAPAPATDLAEQAAVEQEPTLPVEEQALSAEEQRLAELERRWQASQDALAEVRVERDALQQELGGLREQMEAMREQLALLLAGGAGADAAGPGGLSPTPPADTPWWGSAYQAAEERSLVLGGAGLAALLGLWLWVRRRRTAQAGPLAAYTTLPPVMGDSLATAMPGGTVAVTNRPPYTPPGMSVTAADSEVPAQAAVPQAEAISEVDIFMAYGRHDEAKALLEANLATEPGRHDLRLKLLTLVLEQGDWQTAEQQMQRLGETGDPALMAEAARLLAKRGAAKEAGASAGAASTRSLDDPTAPVEAPKEGGATCPAVAEKPIDDATAPVGATKEEAATCPAVAEKPMDDATAPAEAPKEAGIEQRETLADGENVVEPPSQSEPIAWDVIDYRPPTLGPEPAPRVETPMQPSIEFPRDESPRNNAFRAPVGAPAEEAVWEVEEVAFPPLDRDNGAAPAEPSPWADLADARRLLESGEMARARTLLQRLLAGAKDARLRDEAQALITLYRL